MSENRISAELSPENQQAIAAAIATIKENLPFLIDLSPEERHQSAKMGDGNKAFVEKVLEISKQNQDFLARSFDLQEFERDVLLYGKLSSILMAFTQLQELIDDTRLAVGSDAYTAALEAYAYAKRGGAPGIDELTALVGRRFKRQGSRNPSEPAA